MTLAQALARATALGLARLDAQLLLLNASGRRQDERAWLLAHDQDALSPPQAQAYEALCARRLGGEPLAYLVGEKEFFGLMLAVDDRVLVPRPDTETLVEWALQVLAARIQEAERSARAAKEAATRKGLIGSGDRSDRIRTYNFPQGRVTDHRINLTLYKLGFVMEGELDEMVEGLLLARKAEQLAELEAA